MIAVDVHVVAWGVAGEADPNVPDAVERARQLIGDYSSSKQTIMLSSVALTEYLCGQSAERNRSIREILSKQFYIAPFDAKCAVIAAELYDRQMFNQIKVDHEVSRVQLKDDIKILATAIAYGASALYTHDAWIPKINQSTQKNKVKVSLLPSLHPAEQPESNLVGLPDAKPLHLNFGDQ